MKRAATSSPDSLFPDPVEQPAEANADVSPILSFDEARRAYPEIGLALYALEPGGSVTLEIVSAGELYTFFAPTAEEAYALAFPPAEEAVAEVEKAAGIFG